MVQNYWFCLHRTTRFVATKLRFCQRDTGTLANGIKDRSATRHFGLNNANEPICTAKRTTFAVQTTHTYYHLSMKKTLLIALLAVSAGLSAQEQQDQSLYERVYKDASEKVNDPESSIETIEINQFKVTALNYMSSKVEELGQQRDAYFYDSQAVNLKCFVDDFIVNITKARAISTDKRKDVIACYRNASLQNPLFGDADTERTFCYVNDTKTYTPFSLDTDWEKAYNEANTKVRAILQ